MAGVKRVLHLTRAARVAGNTGGHDWLLGWFGTRARPATGFRCWSHNGDLSKFGTSANADVVDAEESRLAIFMRRKPRHRLTSPPTLPAPGGIVRPRRTVSSQDTPVATWRRRDQPASSRWRCSAPRLLQCGTSCGHDNRTSTTWPCSRRRERRRGAWGRAATPRGGSAPLIKMQSDFNDEPRSARRPRDERGAADLRRRRAVSA